MEIAIVVLIWRLMWLWEFMLGPKFITFMIFFMNCYEVFVGCVGDGGEGMR